MLHGCLVVGLAVVSQALRRIGKNEIGKLEAEQACDWQCYLHQNPDVKRVFGNIEARAKSHYDDYGHAEGRQCTCLLDWCVGGSPGWGGGVGCCPKSSCECGGSGCECGGCTDGHTRMCESSTDTACFVPRVEPSQPEVHTCSPLNDTDTDIPRLALLDSTLPAESLLIMSMDAVGSIDFKGNVGKQTISVGSALVSLAMASKHFLNPMLNCVLGAIVFMGRASPTGANNNKAIQQLLDHVDKMIERKFDQFALEEQWRNMYAIVDNMECAVSEMQWTMIAAQFSIAELFGLYCIPEHFDKMKCLVHQTKNGGNKIMMEIVMTELMVTAWLEAKRNGWHGVEAILQGKLLTAIALLRGHLTVWKAHRLRHVMFTSGEVRAEQDSDAPRDERWTTCFTCGRDLARDAGWDGPSCMHRRSGHCGGCFPGRWKTLDAFKDKLAKCRSEYIASVQKEIEDVVEPQIAAMEALTWKIELYR